MRAALDGLRKISCKVVLMTCPPSLAHQPRRNFHAVGAQSAPSDRHRAAWSSFGTPLQSLLFKNGTCCIAASAGSGETAPKRRVLRAGAITALSMRQDAASIRSILFKGDIIGTVSERAMKPVLTVLALACGPALADEPVTPVMAQVIIVASTPLPGIGLHLEQVAGAVQTASARDIERSGAVDLSDFLNRSLGSVHVNESQGNPLMMDVSYRGYTASPLLGTPQGLSVYMDGVRLNQPFGDVVLWDLIPKDAIASVSLMGGANPLFGLNTLGGALAIRTKDGRSDGGTVVEASSGSFGRRNLGFQYGASTEALDWLLIANGFREAGWRDDSPSRLGQLFGKLGWHDATSSLKLSYAYAHSELNGNGLQEAEMIAGRRASVFTKPDTTINHASFVNLEAQSQLSERLQLSANAYYRNTRTATTNGDLNDAALGESVYYTGQKSDRAWLAANGFGNPNFEAEGSFPQLRCIAQAGRNAEPNEKCNGLVTTTASRQQNAGVSAQLGFVSPGNQAVIGAAWDASRVGFRQSSQFGYLNADRSITPVAAFADGSQDSENAFDQRVDLTGKVHTWSLFGSDTVTLATNWHLTLSSRYNRTRLVNSDGLFPYNNATTGGEQRGSLDGDHVFRRFNPAVGLSFTPSRAVNAYAGYSESSRTPTSIELGCADPNFGCRLPNSMAGDPPLDQVVSKTWEAGLRGKLTGRSRWNVGLFRGDNHNDIIFVANSASTGFFKNVGKTRREGVEAGVASVGEHLTLSADATWLNATYQSNERLGSEMNSSAENGAIEVRPGDRMPSIPRKILKAAGAYQWSPSLSAGLQVIAIGSSFVRGNENNQHVLGATSVDGVTTTGGGQVPGYAVVNLNASYQPAPGWTVSAHVSNLLNRQYATVGQLGPRAFTPDGGFRNTDSEGATFFTPGSPRAVSIGLRHAF
jgi:outer membrane receptor protein involved in Fe transport